MAIAAIISPYTEDRRDARQIVLPYGPFLEIWLDTPIDICKKRDRRGYYRRAELGLIPSFSGISDIYEQPEYPDLILTPNDDLALQIEKTVDLLNKREIFIHAAPESCSQDRLRSQTRPAQSTHNR